MLDNQKKLEIDRRNQESYQSVFKSEKFSLSNYAVLEETLALSNEISYRDGRYYSIVLLAANGIGLGNYDRAYNLLEQLNLEIIMSESNTQVQMIYYNAYMIYYYEYMRDYGKALKYCSLELTAVEVLKKTYDIIRVRLNLAVINGKLGYRKTAEQTYREIIEYGESLDDNHILPYCYVNLAEGLYEDGDYQQSLLEYEKALSVVINNNLLTLEYLIYYHMARVYNKLGEFSNAFNRLSDAKKIEDDHNKTGEKFNRLHEQVNTALALGFNDDILQEINEWESNLRYTESTEVIGRFYLDKSKVYAALNQFENAYEAQCHYVKYAVVTDKKQNDEALSKSIHEAYSEELNRLDAIAAIGRELTMLSDIDEMIIKLRKEFKIILSTDFIGISLIKGNQLDFSNYFNDNRKIEPKSTSLDSEVSLAVWSINHDEAVVINNLKADYPKYIKRIGVFEDSKDEAIKSVLIGPLKVAGEIIGVFTVQSYKENAYSSVEVKIHKIITDYLAVAVSNAKQTESLRRLSIEDNLTKISNRRGFIDFFNNRLFEKNVSDESISLIMLDLDYFKSVNDSFGHVIGDKVLCGVADILMSKETDDVFAARLGGEEFALLVYGSTRYEIRQLSESIRLEIEKLRIYDVEKSVSVTTSVGVVYQDAATIASYDKLYNEADKALYLAKDTGRNRVVVFD